MAAEARIAKLERQISKLQFERSYVDPVRACLVPPRCGTAAAVIPEIVSSSPPPARVAGNGRRGGAAGGLAAVAMAGNSSQPPTVSTRCIVLTLCRSLQKAAPEANGNGGRTDFQP